MNDHDRLRASVISLIEAELTRLTHAALDARDESISEESRPENKYDTHAQEAAYLAEGQARLVAELRAALAAWQAMVFPSPGGGHVQVGSIVTLSSAPPGDRILIGPAKGGLTVRDASGELTVVTPGSPLGARLLGARAGSTIPPLRKGSPAPRILRID